ncbi:putative cyclase-domain-containing protein [Cryomyces antarcticus]
MVTVLTGNIHDTRKNSDLVKGEQVNGDRNGRSVSSHSEPRTLKRLPSYRSLPPVSGMPHGCTWGLWNRPESKKDELGTLNLLTPSVKAAARAEIQAGISVGINWSMENCQDPHSNRRKPEHRIMELPDWVGHDDEVTMNTQGGSQWDGFRHWAHQPTGLYYNGVTHAEIMDNTKETRNGIDQWTAHGAIVGRGILLDYLSWATERGISYSPIERHPISEKDLEAVARAQGTEFEEGDILLIRSGFVKWHNEASEEERKKGTVNGSEWAGLEGNRESVEWLWNRHFAAVGGDANVFEAWPAKDERYRLHDNLIALFGTPIGEMFNLEELAEVCKAQKRWSFFFTSAH